MFSTLDKIQWNLPRLTSVTSDNSLMVRWRSPFSTVLIDAAMDVWMIGSRLRSSSSIFWSLNLLYHLQTMTLLADIFPLLLWSNLSILVVVLPKSAQNLIFGLISDRSCDTFWRQKFDALPRGNVVYFKGQRQMWNFDIMSYMQRQRILGSFMTFGSHMNRWAPIELSIRTGANLRCYGYKCDRCIKGNVRIIPKLQNWIGNILFFENMHISVIFPKIKKSYGQSLRTSGTTFVCTFCVQFLYHWGHKQEPPHGGGITWLFYVFSKGNLCWLTNFMFSSWYP